jgi:hypothetical protein
MSASDRRRDVAARHGVPLDRLMGRDRYAEVALARAELVWWLACELDWSISRIARFCDRSRSAILHILGGHGRQRRAAVVSR